MYMQISCNIKKLKWSAARQHIRIVPFFKGICLPCWVVQLPMKFTTRPPLPLILMTNPCAVKSLSRSSALKLTEKPECKIVWLSFKMVTWWSAFTGTKKLKTSKKKRLLSWLVFPQQFLLKMCGYLIPSSLPNLRIHIWQFMRSQLLVAFNKSP